MFEVSFLVKYLHYSICFIWFYLFNCVILCTVCLFLLPCFPFTPNITKWWEEPVFLWVPDSIEGGGCFSVGEFLFHRVIEGDSWLLIFIQQKKMQTNVKQRRKNHNESKKTFICIFCFCFDLFRAEPLSDAVRRALFNPHYVLSSPDFR